MDFNEVYDFVTVLVVAYHDLRRDGLVVIGEDKYKKNPDLAAVRDLFEEHMLVPILILSTHNWWRFGGHSGSRSAVAQRSALHQLCIRHDAVSAKLRKIDGTCSLSGCHVR